MSYKPLKKYMEAALKEARKNIRKQDGGPFGACIVKNGEILAVSRNRVLASDATNHAEISAIRSASKKLGTFDLHGAVIYSTTEPCPMCFSAIHWARIGHIVYGSAIKDVKKLGFNELTISNKTMKKIGGSDITIYPGFMKSECGGLLSRWAHMPKRIIY